MVGWDTLRDGVGLGPLFLRHALGVIVRLFEISGKGFMSLSPKSQLVHFLIHHHCGSHLVHYLVFL